MEYALPAVSTESFSVVKALVSWIVLAYNLDLVALVDEKWGARYDRLQELDDIFDFLVANCMGDAFVGMEI